MISRLTQENQWDEDGITNLPAEDDRFEFKENLELQNIAKEICAFANSFGGTLFLGIKDKTHEIIGIPKKFPVGSRSDTVDWLERKIPSLLAFRFNAFRIRPVKLTTKTQRLMGNNKIALSIDIFDSDTSPYQIALKGSYMHHYYYRENSSSVFAPHSHLAYLWLRNSTDKTRVVQYLITNFLTPLISFIEGIIKDFTEFKFHHTNRTNNGEDYIELNFVSWSVWKSNIETLAAEQFLQQEDSINLAQSLTKLSLILRDFEMFLETFNKTVLNQATIDIKKLRNSIEPNKSGDLSAFSEKAAQTLTYALFNLRSIWGIPKHLHILREYLKRNVLQSLNKNPYFKGKKSEVKLLRKEILEVSKHILEQSKMLRHNLCLRYNTIYSDIQLDKQSAENYYQITK